MPEKLTAPPEEAVVDAARVVGVACKDRVDHCQNLVVRNVLDDERLRVAAGSNAAKVRLDHAVSDQDVVLAKDDDVADLRLATIIRSEA